MPAGPLQQTEIPGLPVRRGKVRDVYDLGERVLLVATDRISAYDWVLPDPIPDKGRVLTRLSEFWFDLLAERAGVVHHLVTTDVHQMDLPPEAPLEHLAGRSMLCQKTDVVPFECVARGYLSGSGWREYQESGAVCGVPLEEGLEESARLGETIFTPATKAEQGEHDENVSFTRMKHDLGESLAEELRSLTLKIYNAGVQHALARGVLIADTKFEFGMAPGRSSPLLIDEVLTPDSSRFWRADDYAPGGPQASFDKQFVRDWLLSSGWDRESEPPQLPESVVARTREKYVEAYELITGKRFD